LCGLGVAPRDKDNALALALARLIVRGIFERFPTLRIVGTHLGGSICEMIGRMDYAYRLQDEAYFLGPYEPMLIKHPPSHYLKMMYLESTCSPARGALRHRYGRGRSFHFWNGFAAAVRAQGRGRGPRPHGR
jgi:hypothetical protein